MYKLYEKVRKSKENMYGSKPIEENENPFSDGPCLLCISAQHDNSFAVKSNFGVTKEGMKMARLRVRGEKNAGFDLKKFPVKFLSMQLERKVDEKQMNDEEQLEEFIDKYLAPLISNKGQKIDCMQAMKNMRNVNIMPYCDATVLVQRIEENLINKMKDLGYTEEECDKIQSQMCMFPISTNRLNGTQKSTCISFMDINDYEINDNVTEEERKLVEESEIGESFITYSENEKAYLFDGDGEHDLKKYTKEGAAMHVCLSSVMSKALENSIKNASGIEFEPISAELITSDVKNIMQKATNGVSEAELTEELDNNLIYGGAKRLSEDEIELLDQLDQSYDYQMRIQKELEVTKSSLKTVQENLVKTDEAINENCSEITRLKILVSRGYQIGASEKFDLETILKSPSDKQLLEERNISIQALVMNALESEASRDGIIHNVDMVEKEALREENSKEGVSLDD